MEQPDKSLVHRLACQHDSDAFSAIMTQYADMVYSTCRRVLGNDGQAADAVQETFFHLLKNADRITGSLGSWLHQVATRRSIDLIRQNAARRRREEAYAADTQPETKTWEEIEPLVDEALEELPEEQKELLVLHYLERQSMVQSPRPKTCPSPPYPGVCRCPGPTAPKLAGQWSDSELGRPVHPAGQQRPSCSRGVASFVG